MIAALVLGVLAQDTAAKPADPALFAELIRKTNEVGAFVADYRMLLNGQEQGGPIRIVYRAPDTTKISVGETAIYRILDGAIDVRLHLPGEKPMDAHVPMSRAIVDRYTRLAAAMRSEFPSSADAWSPGCDPGIRFDLLFEGSAGSTELTFQFMASYACKPSVRFGWLEELAKKDPVRTEGEHLVFTEPGGAQIFLSTRTGFVEKVEKHTPEGEKRFQLASLDTSPNLDASAFDLPPRPPDAIEGSAFWGERFHQFATQAYRRRMLETVAALVADGKAEWNPEARAHLAKVLAVLHADAWTFEHEIWISEMRRRMKDFAAWLREKLADPSLADVQSRASLESAIGDWRKGLSLSAESALAPRTSEMTIGADVSVDASLRAAFAEVEKEAVQATLKSAVVDPLLREFDELVEHARRAD